MFSLQTLREARAVVRWMLVWFALSIGVAVAAPVVHPQAMTLICTTAGSVKFVTASAPDSGEHAASTAAQPHGLECVFCLPAGAPPATGLSFSPPVTRAAALPSVALAALHLGPRDPASARGPPVLR